MIDGGLDGTPARSVLECTDPAGVAQLVEHFTRNEGVPGSNPGVGSPGVKRFAGIHPHRPYPPSLNLCDPREEGHLFTDEARLPGARMGHRHLIEAVEGGGSRLTNTINLEGALAPLWRRILGPGAERTLPDAQRAAAELARGG